MPQKQIEEMAGITTQEIADYIMNSKSADARNAMSLLKMQCDRYEHCGMALLKAAVDNCKAKMNEPG